MSLRLRFSKYPYFSSFSESSREPSDSLRPQSSLMFFGESFSLFATIFQCHTISNAWKSWDSPHPRRGCTNLNAAAWAHAAISIVIDLWMLAVPLYEVFHLQLSIQKKLNVCIMFFFGTFATIISIFRLRYLIFFATSQNPSWDQFGVVLWSTIELNIGLICASLPALRGIFLHILASSPGTQSEPDQNKPSPRADSSGRKPGPDTILLQTCNDDVPLVHRSYFGSKNSVSLRSFEHV